jgi:hypothetical protein
MAGMKGKGKMNEDVKSTTIRGKVTDAKRVTEYLQYQNSQHDMAVGHIQHAAKQLESLRLAQRFGSVKLKADKTGSVIPICSLRYHSSRWGRTTGSRPT